MRRSVGLCSRVLHHARSRWRLDEIARVHDLSRFSQFLHGPHVGVGGRYHFDLCPRCRSIHRTLVFGLGLGHLRTDVDVDVAEVRAERCVA
jgi:hypothetical protein